MDNFNFNNTTETISAEKNKPKYGIVAVIASTMAVMFINSPIATAQIVNTNRPHLPTIINSLLKDRSFGADIYESSSDTIETKDELPDESVKPKPVIDDTKFGSHANPRPPIPKPTLRKISIGDELKTALEQAGIKLLTLESKTDKQEHPWMRDIGSVNTQGVFIVTSLKTDQDALFNATSWLKDELNMTGSTLNPTTIATRELYLKEIQKAGYKIKEVDNMFIQGGDIEYFKTANGNIAIIGINTLFVNIYMQNNANAIKLVDLEGIAPTLLESQLADLAIKKANLDIKQKLKLNVWLHRVFPKVSKHILNNINKNTSSADYLIAKAIEDESLNDKEISTNPESDDYKLLKKYLREWVEDKKDPLIENFTPDSFEAKEWSHLIGQQAANLNLTNAEKTNILAKIISKTRSNLSRELGVNNTYLFYNQRFHIDLSVGSSFTIKEGQDKKPKVETVMAISDPKLSVNAIIKAIIYYRSQRDYETANKLQELIKGTIDHADVNQTYNPDTSPSNVSLPGISPNLFTDEIRQSGVEIVYVPGELATSLDGKRVNLINFIPVITQDKQGNPVSTIITSTSGYKQLDQHLAEGFAKAGVQLVIPIDTRYLFTRTGGSVRCLTNENNVYNLESMYAHEKP